MRFRTLHYGRMLLMVAMISGCNKPEPTVSINSPPGNEESKSSVGEFFAYHNDQGMMADMSIADIHFIPNTEFLSGTGEARLERYAELLATTGGELHYDTRLSDSSLVNARMRVAKDYLAQVNVGAKPIQVTLGMPQGRGMNAREAIAGQGVAQQPEPRNTAYKLSSDAGGSN